MLEDILADLVVRAVCSPGSLTTVRATPQVRAVDHPRILSQPASHGFVRTIARRQPRRSHCHRRTGSRRSPLGS
jgi:hypothetical protein